MRLNVKNPRKIFDRKAFVAQLAGLANAEPDADFTTPKLRSAVLALYKQQLALGHGEIQRRFEAQEASGAGTLRAGAYLLDQIILSLFDFTLSHTYPELTEKDLAAVATGGYGRGEIAPQSDLDIMFLIRSFKTKDLTPAVEWMLYMLWDLGLKVGHATRTVNETVEMAKADITISTSLLEARWLCGDIALFKAFEHSYENSVVKGTGPEFVKAKLAERDDRHDRMGDTRYVLEPNLKDGKGGLRDLQTLLWIAKYLYRVDTVKGLVEANVLDTIDAQRFSKAQRFLWTERCHLHYISNRPDETISFDVQTELAQRMGYMDRQGSRAVERFMKHYFLTARDVGDLTRVICAVLENQHRKKARIHLPSFNFRKNQIPGFKLERGRLNVVGVEVFQEDPIKILRLFAEAEKFDLDIHPEALRLVQRNLMLIKGKERQNPEANALFLDMLCSKKGPRRSLNRLSEAGVLGRFIPDFGFVTAQMQYDMYHVYTVDEHTIRAVDIVSRIERGLLADDHPLATKVIHDIQSRRVLYIAVFLHDIAKGRGGDHAVVGAEIAKKLCPRFGLNEGETETVEWLVLHHLDMNRNAYKRDLSDPQTAKDFMDLVQSPERLRLLLILTVADTRAVGPTVWNGWKASLLRELYYTTQEEMSGTLPSKRRNARTQKTLKGLRQILCATTTPWTDDDVDWFIALGHANYFVSFEAEALARHAAIVLKAKNDEKPLYIETRAVEHIDVTEVLIHSIDHPGLFSAITGAMALSGASIVVAKITTLSNSTALDMFWIQDIEGHAFTGKARLNRLKSRIQDALHGRIRLKQELDEERSRRMTSRTEVFEVPPRVLVNNKASKSATVIEVNGRNRQGFLYDISSTLSQCGVQITSAHISTYGERVVDVFYVRDIFGLKIDQDSKIKTLQKALLRAIGDAKGEPLLE
ncbi:MAG: [protein-PII] uridylyltransferase [Magnetovibrio sp.]|nr:[protein-PII] uridylyltransferase [Magnetovibrio sp.]